MTITGLARDTYQTRNLCSKQELRAQLYCMTQWFPVNFPGHCHHESAPANFTSNPKILPFSQQPDECSHTRHKILWCKYWQFGQISHYTHEQIIQSFKDILMRLSTLMDVRDIPCESPSSWQTMWMSGCETVLFWGKMFACHANSGVAVGKGLKIGSGEFIFPIKPRW